MRQFAYRFVILIILCTGAMHVTFSNNVAAITGSYNESNFGRGGSIGATYFPSSYSYRIIHFGIEEELFMMWGYQKYFERGIGLGLISQFGTFESPISFQMKLRIPFIYGLGDVGGPIVVGIGASQAIKFKVPLKKRRYGPILIAGIIEEVRAITNNGGIHPFHGFFIKAGYEFPTILTLH